MLTRGTFVAKLKTVGAANGCQAFTEALDTVVPQRLAEPGDEEPLVLHRGHGKLAFAKRMFQRLHRRHVPAAHKLFGKS
eukprot:5163089-Amphidinium_carterae.1